MMKDLPAEIGCLHRGMGEEADDIVDPTVRAGSTVTALMTNDPYTGEFQALEPPVGEPSGAATERVGEGKSLAGQGPEESGQGKIVRMISKAHAVLWTKNSAGLAARISARE